MTPIIVICGIGTNVGKTVVSAILASLTGFDYWKPVQAGNLDASDGHTVKQWVTNPSLKVHPETYRLQKPCSPHLAARLEGKNLSSKEIKLPSFSQGILIEMAGGVMVPINSNELLIDAFSPWDCQWILVSKHYLGSINHTLLSVEFLRARGCKLLGIIFNGPSHPVNESFLLNYTSLPCIGRLLPEKQIDSTTLQTYAKQWKKHFLCFQKTRNTSGTPSRKPN